MLKSAFVLLLVSCGSLFAINNWGGEYDNLPHVLLIGDSISIGYTPYVAHILENEAVVLHNEGNAEDTWNGQLKLEQWLGNTDWDVIHFNWGLWDLAYRNPESNTQGKRDKDNGTLTTTLEQYESNLVELVERLQQTEAKLIWAQTTMVPAKEAGRIEGDAKHYNAVALRVMKQHDVTINNLYTVSAAFASDIFIDEGNVHFTDTGSKQLADPVVSAIRSALE
jgi:hypothetical protein